MKKIIYLSISLVLIIVSIVFSSSILNFNNLNLGSSKEVKTINKSLEVLETIDSLLYGLENQDYFDEIEDLLDDSDYENMTYLEENNCKLEQKEESDDRTATSSMFANRVIKISFTEDAVHIIVDLYSSSTKEYDYDEGSKSDYKTGQTVDCNMEYYVTENKEYIKFNRYIQTQFYEYGDEKETEVLNLFEDYEVAKLQGCWIESSNDFYSMFINLCDSNRAFLNYVGSSLYVQKVGNNLYKKEGNDYILKEEHILDCMSTGTLGDYLDSSLSEKDYEGNFKVALGGNGITMDLLYKVEQKDNGNKLGVFEDSLVKIMNINNTKVVDINEDDAYDSEELYKLFGIWE